MLYLIDVRIFTGADYGQIILSMSSKFLKVVLGKSNDWRCEKSPDFCRGFSICVI